MARPALRHAALIAAACALAACADSPITSPARPGGATAGPSYSMAGGQAKVDVCHRMAKGFIKITVGAPAVQAHMDHGDMLPGSFTPDFLWYMTPDCQLVPNGVTIG